MGNTPCYENLSQSLKGQEDSATRVFPKNALIESACLRENFYKSKLKTYIFNRIVHHATTERDEVRYIKRGLTIDHIMPRKWIDKTGWSKTLEGADMDVINYKIHTIGNLTPMSKGLNSAKSNHDWNGTKGAKAHLNQCDLKLTRCLAEKDKWGLEDIDERSKELAKIICEIWREEICENPKLFFVLKKPHRLKISAFFYCLSLSNYPPP